MPGRVQRVASLRGLTRLRVFSLPGLSIAALLLSGCQNVLSTSTGSQVRVIQASPDAPGLDIYVNSNVFAYNIGFGSVTSYVAVDAGTDTVSANTAGTKQVLASAKNTFLTGQQYTVLLGNVAANLQEQVLTDQAQAPNPVMVP